MRTGVWLALAGAALPLSGCGSHNDETQNVAAMQAELDIAHEQIAALRGQAALAKDASDALQLQVARFQTDNWRDVVPDVVSASEQVEQAQDALQSSANSADSGDD